MLEIVAAKRAWATSSFKAWCLVIIIIIIFVSILIATAYEAYQRRRSQDLVVMNA